MICRICHTETVERLATLESPYHYTVSGLSNVFLVVITIERCVQCGTDAPIIPRVVELNRLIAKGIVEKAGLLSGEELRYLRKFARLSAKRFAALLEVSASYLSRFENGRHCALGGAADKLARALAMSLSADQGDVRKILLQVADGRIQARKQARKKSAPPTYQLIRNRWTKAA